MSTVRIDQSGVSLSIPPLVIIFATTVIGAIAGWSTATNGLSLSLER